MTRTRLLLALLATLPAVASAAPTKLLCQDTSYSATKMRKTIPAFGVDVYEFDVQANTVHQLQGTHRTHAVLSVRISETEIWFAQQGTINEPGIKETFETSISRVSGQWVSAGHYVDKDGQVLVGAELEKAARANGVWDGFNAIRTLTDHGDCVPYEQKF